MDPCYCALLLITTILSITFITCKSSTTFTIKNNCPYTIWPAAQDNPNSPPLATTGFPLDQGDLFTIGAPSGWAGRIWARTFCDINESGRFECPIGDCGTGQVSCNGNSNGAPGRASKVEFQLNGFGKSDYYDVSLVDGFNLAVAIAPQTDGCRNTSCPVDLNAMCPANLSIKASNGGVIGCKSDPQLFKSLCPDVYVSPSDQATFSCPAGGGYVITFCPSSSDSNTRSEYLGMICIL